MIHLIFLKILLDFLSSCVLYMCMCACAHVCYYEVFDSSILLIQLRICDNFNKV